MVVDAYFLALIIPSAALLAASWLRPGSVFSLFSCGLAALLSLAADAHAAGESLAAAPLAVALTLLSLLSAALHSVLLALSLWRPQRVPPL